MKGLGLGDHGIRPGLVSRVSGWIHPQGCGGKDVGGGGQTLMFRFDDAP